MLKKVVEVGFYKGNNTVYDINILEHIYEYISTGENILKNVDVTKNITILLNIYNQALTFGIYNIGTGIKNYYNYIKFPSTYFFEKYFCFKIFTPKEKKIEELGEISYDFQIYYDEQN